MSIQSQTKHMRKLGALLGQDLGYIHGEKEQGPNGAKADFHRIGKTFLRGLAKDLKFTQFKVTSNVAGIAVSGDVTMYGMWADGNGLMFQLSEAYLYEFVGLYRKIAHMKDYASGRNLRIHRDFLLFEDYEALVYLLKQCQVENAYERAA